MAEEVTYGDGETAEDVIATLNEIIDEAQTSHSKLASQLNRIKEVVYREPLNQDRYYPALKEIIGVINE